MSQPQVKLTVTPEGDLIIEPLGVVGPICKQISAVYRPKHESGSDQSKPELRQTADHEQTDTRRSERA